MSHHCSLRTCWIARRGREILPRDVKLSEDRIENGTEIVVEVGLLLSSLLCDSSTCSPLRHVIQLKASSCEKGWSNELRQRQLTTTRMTLIRAHKTCLQTTLTALTCSRLWLYSKRRNPTRMLTGQKDDKSGTRTQHMSRTETWNKSLCAFLFTFRSKTCRARGSLQFSAVRSLRRTGRSSTDELIEPFRLLRCFNCHNCEMLENKLPVEQAQREKILRSEWKWLSNSSLRTLKGRINFACRAFVSGRWHR